MTDSLTDMLDFGPQLDVAARSCAGARPGRENQDNLVAIDAHGRAVLLREQVRQTAQVAGWPPGHVRLAVLDGMGGHGHGREAAQAAAQGLLDIPACATLASLSCRLDALHDRLQAHFIRLCPDDARRPGTTLTLLELPAGQPPLLYHVGDSRLYEISPTQARVLTVDHVPATTLALQGLLGEQAWWRQVHGEHSPQIAQAFILGNAISDPRRLADPLYALGAGQLPPFLRQLGDRRALTLRGDALYLLATDGFWACAEPQAWVARWPALLGDPGRSAGAALACLFDSFILTPPPGLHVDNLSAIALRFHP